MFKKILRPLHPSWSFYTLVYGIIIGIIVSLVSEQALITGFFWLLLSVALVILCLRHACVLTAGIILLVGLLLGNFRTSLELSGKAFAENLIGQTVTLSGQLTADPDSSSGKLALQLRNLRINPSSEHSQEISGTIYVTISTEAQLERSDLVTLTGKLEAGFGTFIAKMSRPKLISIDRSNPGDIFAKFKHWFSDLVRQFIPPPQVDLGLGYLMGQKSGLSKEFSAALQAVGMTHVVVASGAHLGILTGAAKKLFGKISKFAGLLFSLLMILGFVFIVGFTPSMTRAALVASLSLVAGYFGRHFTPLRLISFVAMLTLLINPTNFLNLGWQLSFASFFGILILAPRLQRTFYGGKNPPWLASMLITSAATSLLCAPVLICNFGTLSFLSFVANLIILPTLPYAMLGMMLTGVTSFFVPLAQLIAQLTTWLLDLHIWLINFLSEQTAFILELPATPLFFLLYLPVLTYLAYPTLHKIFRRLRSQHRSPQSSAPHEASLQQLEQ